MILTIFAKELINLPTFTIPSEQQSTIIAPTEITPDSESPSEIVVKKPEVKLNPKIVIDSSFEDDAENSENKRSKFGRNSSFIELFIP